MLLIKKTISRSLPSISTRAVTRRRSPGYFSIGAGLFSSASSSFRMRVSGLLGRRSFTVQSMLPFARVTKETPRSLSDHR